MRNESTRSKRRQKNDAKNDTSYKIESNCAAKRHSEAMYHLVYLITQKQPIRDGTGNSCRNFQLNLPRRSGEFFLELIKTNEE